MEPSPWYWGLDQFGDSVPLLAGVQAVAADLHVLQCAADGERLQLQQQRVQPAQRIVGPRRDHQGEPLADRTPDGLPEHTVPVGGLSGVGESLFQAVGEHHDPVLQPEPPPHLVGLASRVQLAVDGLLELFEGELVKVQLLRVRDGAQVDPDRYDVAGHQHLREADQRRGLAGADPADQQQRAPGGLVPEPLDHQFTQFIPADDVARVGIAFGGG